MFLPLYTNRRVSSTQPKGLQYPIEGSPVPNRRDSSTLPKSLQYPTEESPVPNWRVSKQKGLQYPTEGSPVPNQRVSNTQPKGLQYPTDRRLGGPRSQYGGFRNREIFCCYSQRRSRVLNRGPSRYQAGMLPTWQKYSIVTYGRTTFYDPELSTSACWSEARHIKSRWRNTNRQQQQLNL
jgi:hypothetical protein